MFCFPWLLSHPCFAPSRHYLEEQSAKLCIQTLLCQTMRSGVFPESTGSLEFVVEDGDGPWKETSSIANLVRKQMSLFYTEAHDRFQRAARMIILSVGLSELSMRTRCGSWKGVALAAACGVVSEICQFLTRTPSTSRPLLVFVFSLLSVSHANALSGLRRTR